MRIPDSRRLRSQISPAARIERRITVIIIFISLNHIYVLIRNRCHIIHIILIIKIILNCSIIIRILLHHHQFINIIPKYIIRLNRTIPISILYNPPSIILYKIFKEPLFDLVYILILVNLFII